MTGRGTSTVCLGRQLVSCLAAYALVLQAILFSFAPFAPVLAGSADGLPGMEICLHGAGPPDGAPSAPSHQPGEDKLSHCKLCLVGCPQQILAPLALAVAQPVEVASATVRWFALFAPHEISQFYPSKPPRGPPATS